LGRWAKDVLKCIQDKRWWALIRITAKVREPLDHFCHYLMKTNREENGVQPIARLVWYKSTFFMKKLADMCDQECWPEWVDPTLIDPSLVDRCRDIALRIALRNESDYQIRIHQHIQQEPCRLLWFAKADPDIYCKERQELCQFMRDTTNMQLHITARKVKQLFPADIANGANTGKVSLALYSAMRLIALKFKIDVQEIEGINNVIQQVAKKAPRITLPVLDARVALRKMLGIHNNQIINQLICFCFAFLLIALLTCSNTL
jgi:hypothetical protein